MIFTLSLHDALPISVSDQAWRETARRHASRSRESRRAPAHRSSRSRDGTAPWPTALPSASSPCCRRRIRSEEHTSELQSRRELVCRLLLEKKKIKS